MKKRTTRTLRVGKNWMKFDYQLIRLLEERCKRVGIPIDNDVDELLNYFGIKEVSEAKLFDSCIEFRTPKGQVKMVFVDAITFRRKEIWIGDDKLGYRKYAVVPETKEQPWHTIYLGSNVSIGDRSMVTHIDEMNEERSVGKWVIKQNKHEVLEVYVETFGGHKIYYRAQEIEDCLKPYLQENTELDASEIYCWIMNTLQQGKDKEENNQKESDLKIDIEKMISINVTVWDEKQIEKSMVMKGTGGLNGFIFTSGKEKVELYMDGTSIWQSDKGKIFRAGEACVGSGYNVTVDINAADIQNAGKHVDNIIEQAERTFNKYMPIFE